MNCGVYKITIGPKGFYFGSSNNLRDRHRKHILQLQKGEHGNVRMQRAWNKYQELTFEIVEHCDPDERLAVEQKYLDEWMSHEDNFNLAPVAGGGCRQNLTEEHKRKISAGLKGKPKSDSVREALRYKRSKETCQKMSFAAKNRSSEINKRISATLLGHPVSVETKSKLRQKARKLTNEQIVEMRSLHAAGGWTHSVLASKFGVSRSLVSMIVANKLWTEVS